MSWWAALPGTLALAALWVAPGWAVLRGLGVRGLVGLGAAPAVTAALLGLLGVGYQQLGVRWSLASLLAGLVLAAVVAAAAGLLLETWRPSRGVIRRSRPAMSGSGLPAGAALPAPLTGGQALLLGGSLLAAAVLTAGPLMAGMGGPDRPEQAWDAVFHLNALALVRESGNASIFGALGPLYGEGAPYYPTVWHAMAAVAPGLASVPAAANVQNLVLAAVVWPLGLAALTRASVRGAMPAVLAPVVAASFVAFPTVVLTVLATWPFGLSIAVLPGALAALLVALRTPWRWRPKAAVLLAAAAALAGVVLAHGSGVFSVLALAGVTVVVILARQARHWWTRGRPRVVAAAAAGALALALAGAALLTRVPALWATLGFERAGGATYRSALGLVLVDAPLVYDYGPPGYGHLAITVLGALGAVLCLVRKRSRWLVAAWVTAIALVLLAAGPAENPLRTLAGFWYTQAARIAPLVVIPAVVLAAIGLAGAGAAAARAAGAGEPRARTVAALAVPAALLAVVAVVTGGLRWDLKERVTASVYEPGQIAWGTMLSGPELAMMTRLGGELPADAVVLGDPFNGSAYLPALAGAKVVFPQLGPVRGADARTLETSLDRLRTDPAVCAAARALGVTHLYTDTATRAAGAKEHARTTAMRGVDTTTGHELVDRAGTAAVWRLTACD
ncbi:DUF6541 family protein [Georgenia ruanii]|uniref:DUF6541 family protein n=1 Tax=Georgenia ruanii TaxID=348442 RepID=UPI001264E0E8|nr:DUF6541 family protein [Georgenia ruanii]